MAIRKEQKGAARAAAAAGTVIGESQKAIREQAIAAQQASQQATLKAREASEQRAMQWEVDKMQFRSQQDFEQELRRNQFSYDRENRAQEWDIEKAEIASRMDFERDEKERQTRLDRIASSRGEIDRKVERGDATEKQMELFRLNLDLEEQAVYIGAKRTSLNKLPQEDVFGKLLAELQDGQSSQINTTVQAATNSTQAAGQINAAQGVIAEDKDGNEWAINPQTNEWDDDSFYVAGPLSFQYDVIARGGGINVTGALETDYPRVPFAQLLEWNPEMIFICGYDKHLIPRITADQKWRQLNAVQSGRIYQFHCGLTCRTGPRIVDMAELLFQTLYG